jgi:hypothetical protein
MGSKTKAKKKTSVSRKYVPFFPLGFSKTTGFKKIKRKKRLKVDTPHSTENSKDESNEREMNQALAQSTPNTSSERFITHEQFQRLQGMPLMSDFYLYIFF